MSRPSALASLVDLHAALAADRGTEPGRKRTRDRRIGAALTQHKPSPQKQLRGWLDLADVPGGKRDGARAAQVHHLIVVLLAALGLLSGWGLAQAVLHYTGDAPINIVDALVVLVLPQVLLLLLWLAAMAPLRIPFLHGLRSTLRLLNPGRAAGLVAHRLPAARGLDVLWDPEHAIVFAPAARWLFSLWSQWFSVAFNLGALLAVLYLISFSDLAFGWSTTLDLSSDTFYRWVHALAWPWHSFFPQGVPDLALVEASRFFRLDPGAFAGPVPDAQRLGGWWPFLVAALIGYGLLPRLLTLLISWQRFHHHLGVAMTRLPGAPELLARMNSPLVSTAATKPETRPAADLAAPLTLEHPPARRVRCPVVAWSASAASLKEISAGLHALGIEATTLLHAGGSRSTDQDAQTVAALCRQRDQGAAVVAKAWEPPLLEFTDFLQSVRGRCNRQQPLIVLLRTSDQELDRDLEVWNITLQRLRDPDLHVEVLP